MLNHSNKSADKTDTSVPGQSITAVPPCHGEDAGTPDQQNIAKIWSELRELWASGNSARAEKYLSGDFLAKCSQNDAVDIIYAEYVLAEEHGAEPCIDDYVRRFPELAGLLKQQLEFHTAFYSTDDPAEDHESAIQTVSAKSDPESIFPRQFGRYLLVAPLDTGGQSEVYRAIHPELGQEIAIKIARRAVPAVSQTHDSRLQEEARLLASLSHPNLARIFDAGVVDGQSFLAIEYVRGQPLSQYSAMALPSSLDACCLVAKLASAVFQVHSRGILHLDIKPRNVVLDEHGEPRLLDFGLSRQRGGWTELPPNDSVVSGTLEFMAPEQALGESDQLSPATDVFALGGVLYFLLTGHPLYAGKSVGSLLTLAQTCHWNREALNTISIPHSIRRVCERALDPNQRHRFQSADAMARELETCIQPTLKRTPWRLGTAKLIVVGSLCLFGLIGLLYRINHAKIAPTTVPLNLGIEVLNHDRYISLTNAVPLRNGDKIQSRATVQTGMYAAWFLLTSEGFVRELRRYSPADVPRQIHYPDNSHVPLIGLPGTECLLLVTSQEPIPTSVEIQASTNTQQSWPKLSDMSVIRMTPAGIFTEQTDKDFGPPSDLPPPDAIVKQRLEELRSFLTNRGTSFEAIAFSHSK